MAHAVNNRRDSIIIYATKMETKYGSRLLEDIWSGMVIRKIGIEISVVLILLIGFHPDW